MRQFEKIDLDKYMNSFIATHSQERTPVYTYLLNKSAKLNKVLKNSSFEITMLSNFEFDQYVLLEQYTKRGFNKIKIFNTQDQTSFTNLVGAACFSKDHFLLKLLTRIVD